MTFVGLVPVCPRRPGCLAMIRENAGQWTHCPAEPSHVGIAVFDHPRPRHGVRGFACPAHTGLLPDPVLLSDVDRAELDGRRVQHLRAVAGLRYDPPGEV